MSGRIRVLIWYRCPPDKLDSFIETFHAISTQLAGVPGLLRSDLRAARREEGSVVLMSAWESAEAFATWEASARHRPTGAPLREYADTSRPYQFELYQILATRTATVRRRATSQRAAGLQLRPLPPEPEEGMCEA